MGIKDKIIRFMYGRYGQDEFSVFLMASGMIFMFLSMIPKLDILYLLALLSVGYSMYRTFSKDFNKRYKERAWYLKISDKPTRFLKIQIRRFKERKTYDYYKCKKCGAYNRIPKGHGKKIIITCAKCRNEFKK